MCFGGCTEPAPNSPHVVPRICKVWCAIIVVESLLLLTLSSLLFVYHDPVLPTGQVYAVMGIFCVLTMSWFAAEAVLTENKPQFFAFHVVAALLTSFVIFQAFHNPYSLGPLWTDAKYYVVAFKIAFELVYLGMALPVWRSFGFWAYKASYRFFEVERCGRRMQLTTSSSTHARSRWLA